MLLKLDRMSPSAGSLSLRSPDSSSVCDDSSPFVQTEEEDLGSVQVTGWVIGKEEQGEEREGEDSRCDSVGKKYHLNRTLNDSEYMWNLSNLGTEEVSLISVCCTDFRDYIW